MPSAKLIGLQAPKKARRSLVFALAPPRRQIESGLSVAVVHDRRRFLRPFGTGGHRPPLQSPLLFFGVAGAPPSNHPNARLTVIPSASEGSRYATFKITSSGSLDFARDDGFALKSLARPGCAA
jgi:hypothetical protein